MRSGIMIDAGIDIVMAAFCRLELERRRASKPGLIPGNSMEAVP
jgi:hypothetical protein